MKRDQRISTSHTADVLGILDAIAKRQGMNRSEVLTHLIVYQGLCGGDFPLTRKILALAPRDRVNVIKEIRTKAESDTPAKPQGFRQWVKDTTGKDDAETLDRSADKLLRDLLEG